MTQTILDPKIARLYQDVPSGVVREFFEFRETHPCKQIEIDGVPWQYITAGQGNQPLLTLPGALGTAESGWRTILHFSSGENRARYRVIVPSYPFDVASMAALTDGFARLLDAENADKAHVMGGSGGAFMAQAFARRHPRRVAKLVVAMGGPPNAKSGAGIVKALRWMKWLPLFAQRALIKKTLLGLMDPNPHPDIALMSAYMSEVIDRQMTRRGFLNSFQRIADFHTFFNTAVDTIPGWPKEMLIVMAELDPATPEEARARMREMYPQAQIHLMEGIGHTAPLARAEEYYGTLDAFLS